MAPATKYGGKMVACHPGSTDTAMLTASAAVYGLASSGDFARITMTLRDTPGTRSLLKFLNETEQTRRRTSGFSFHIGRAKIEAKDESLFRTTRRTSMAPTPSSIRRP